MFDHNSKLAHHVHEHHHHMDFKNVDVVGHEAHYHQWLFLEAWMSVKDPNAGNDHLVCLGFFCNSRVLVRKLASPFGHPAQVSTQVQLAPTCDYLPFRLPRALKSNV